MPRHSNRATHSKKRAQNRCSQATPSVSEKRQPSSLAQDLWHCKRRCHHSGSKSRRTNVLLGLPPEIAANYFTADFSRLSQVAALAKLLPGFGGITSEFRGTEKFDFGPKNPGFTRAPGLALQDSRCGTGPSPWRKLKIWALGPPIFPPS